MVLVIMAFPAVLFVFRDLSQSNGPLYVLGVVTHFPPGELSPVMTPKKIKAGEDTSKVEQWRIVKLEDGQKAILSRYKTNG